LFDVLAAARTRFSQTVLLGTFEKYVGQHSLTFVLN